MDISITKEYNEIIDTPVWLVKGLITEQEKAEIIELMKKLSPAEMTSASIGKKLSIEHKENRSRYIIESKACRNIMSRVISEKILLKLSELLIKTDSLWGKYASEGGKVLRPFSLGCLSTECNGIDIHNAWKTSLKGLDIKRIASIRQSYEHAYNCVSFVPRMQFSVLRNGSYIPPHTDISNKIATIMIYLPVNQEQENSNLGTSFWKKKEKHAQINQEESRFLINKELEIFKSNYSRVNTRFRGDGAVTFFRSNNSWHSFEYSQPNLGDRYSININFLAPVAPGV